MIWATTFGSLQGCINEAWVDLGGLVDLGWSCTYAGLNRFSESKHMGPSTLPVPVF